jgi:EAL domain-containing protein (putative c-di-GMP-specific phosphodiesterase class I)/GGDEF domain-containing protein/CBS domain-containing protein
MLTVVPGEAVDRELALRLDEIMRERSLTALFQPIVDLGDGRVGAYEGLIRGPSDSPLHSPLQLFRAAALCERSVAVEHLCRRVTLESFARLRLRGDLFLNVSPDCLLQPEARHGETLNIVHQLGIDPGRVVIELTEQQPTYDYDLLREAVRHYRAMGFRIAIDDLGEGFSSLRLWSELRPEFVKIDMHFIQGCDSDPVKRQFLRSIQEIARNAGSQVIAEGIETAAESSCAREIGIARGQGYYFARPAAVPPVVLSGAVADSFVCQTMKRASASAPTAEMLMRVIAPVPPTAIVEDAYALFEGDPGMQSLPVVENGMPCGIIGRYALIDRLARPYSRELFGRKPCSRIMNPSPLLIEINTPLHELGRIVADAAPHHLADGFVIVEDGHYRGVGTGHDLMREITQMKLHAAQHANALSGLPGNESLNRTLSVWLDAGDPFWAAYFDLDHFKPFNDVYGFARGDDMIRLLAQLLREHGDGAANFVAHIGGDDFMVLFRSPDWSDRCQRVLDGFGAAVTSFFAPEDLTRGGYMADDRQGNRVFIPLVSVSVGIVQVDPRKYSTYHQIAAAAAVAKKEAKKIRGNSIFVERRGI